MTLLTRIVVNSSTCYRLTISSFLATCLTLLMVADSQLRAQVRNDNPGEEFIQSTTIRPDGMTVTTWSAPNEVSRSVVGYGSAMQHTPSSGGLIETASVQPRFASQSVLHQGFLPETGQPVLSAPPLVFPSTGVNVTPQFDPSIANQIPTLGLPGNYVTPPPRRPLFSGNPFFEPPRNRLFRRQLLTEQQFSGGQFQNLPPGTYLGQGLLGQPTAYVDGQPMRNLFRFLIYP